MTVEEAQAIWADRTYSNEGYLDAAVRLSQRYGGLDDEEKEALDLLMDEFADLMVTTARASGELAESFHSMATHLANLAKGTR